MFYQWNVYYKSEIKSDMFVSYSVKFPAHNAERNRDHFAPCQKCTSGRFDTNEANMYKMQTIWG